MQIKVADWTSPDFGSFQDLVNKTMNVEAMAMERHTGVSFELLAGSLPAGSRTALTAFIWILRKREEPTLKFDDVSYAEEDLDIIITEADHARRKEAEEAAEAEAARPTGEVATATEEATVEEIVQLD
jgi:hypothetical protein